MCVCAQSKFDGGSAILLRTAAVLFCPRPRYKAQNPPQLVLLSPCVDWLSNEVPSWDGVPCSLRPTLCRPARRSPLASPLASAELLRHTAFTQRQGSTPRRLRRRPLGRCSLLHVGHFGSEPQDGSVAPETSGRSLGSDLAARRRQGPQLQMGARPPGNCMPCPTPRAVSTCGLQQDPADARPTLIPVGLNRR